MNRRQAGTPMQSLFGGISPFSVMRRLSEDMDRLFSTFGLGPSVQPLSSTFGRDLWLEPGATETALWSPQVDVFRRGDELVIRADLPGLLKDDISVDVEDNVLTIRGERHQEQESDEGRGGYYWAERSYGAFQRTIPIPEGTNADDASAEFHDGVLELTVPVPRQPQRRGRSIQVR
jgi:HSP20 family protein